MLLIFSTAIVRKLADTPRGKEVSAPSPTAGGRATKHPFLFTSSIRLRISSKERPPSSVFLIPILEFTNTDIRVR